MWKLTYRPVIRPAALAPGDRIRVIAPSGPFDHTLVWRGMGFLSQRYRVEFSRSMFAREGFLAGPDERRASELNAALHDASLRAIVAARGGYGLTRIAHLLDADALRRSPKWLVGFSDVTALHLEASRLGIASLHAHNAAGLGRGCASRWEAWFRALEHPDETRTLEGLQVWQTGSGRGALVGGNLTVLFACAASGRLRLPDGCVLFLEDIGEAPYRIDRMLSALWYSGALDRISAVAVGEFTDCPTGKHGVSAESVLHERTAHWGVPVVAGIPAGHGLHNVPLHFGYTATIDATRGTLRIEPPC